MLVHDQYIYPEKPDCDDDIVVFHSGFSSTMANYSHGKDTRDYYLIHWVTRGRGTYQTETAKYNLKEGDGFLILPGQTIVHTADKEEPWDLCWIAFFGRKAEEILKEAGLDGEHLIFHYDKDTFLEDCIQNIYKESQTGKNVLYITGQFYLFMARLAEENQKERFLNTESSQFSRFEEAMNYIRRNIRSQISVAQLANSMRLDPSQVYRIFQKHTGRSPQQVIAELRMEKACEFLEKTDLSIRDIAEWLGYEYQSHFTKQFKAHRKMSPSAYRKEYKITESEERAYEKERNIYV